MVLQVCKFSFLFLFVITLVRGEFYVLKPENFMQQIESLGLNYSWAVSQVPFFEINDADIQTAYYFRWKTYREHIENTNTSVGYVVTEFLPQVPWAEKFNTICCAAGHHIYEGRWMHDPTVIDDYSNWWFGGGGQPRVYSFWGANAIWNRYLVDGRSSISQKLLEALVENTVAWNQSNFVPKYGCYYQTDDRDGMEDSISGNGCRPTINSMMYGEMVAIANIAALAGNVSLATYYKEKATNFQHILSLLWNPEIDFFSVFKVDAPSQENSNVTCPPNWPQNELVTVRELLGLSAPYYFELIPYNATSYTGMWAQLLTTQGFAAQWGPRTAEHRAPCYNYSVNHECLWNAPSWPFETSRVISALANLLNNYSPQNVIGIPDYYKLIQQFAIAHTKTYAINGSVPWIGEDLHPDEGYWLARMIMYQENNPLKNRGKDYNHSTFCDLVITGLVGLRPSSSSIFFVYPLADPSFVSYFAVDNLLYHGRNLSILYDSNGQRYGMGSGLYVLCNGKVVATSTTLSRLSVTLC